MTINRARQVAVQLTTDVVALRPAVILGSTVSALCNAMAPLVQAGPVMYCFSPSIRTTPGGYVFTSQIDSHDQQRALLTYFQKKGWKRIALVTTTDASGQDAAKSVKRSRQRARLQGHDACRRRAFRARRCLGRGADRNHACRQSASNRELGDHRGGRHGLSRLEAGGYGPADRGLGQQHDGGSR